MEIYDLKNEQILGIIDIIEKTNSMANDFILMFHRYEDVVVSYYPNFNRNAICPNRRRIDVERHWHHDSTNLTFMCNNDEDMMMFNKWLFSGFSYEFYKENGLAKYE